MEPTYGFSFYWFVLYVIEFIEATLFCGYVDDCCETGSNCSSLMNIDEEQCRIENTDKEAAYASSEIDFLNGLLTNVGGFICHNSKFI